jgi:hypothetical protein
MLLNAALTSVYCKDNIVPLARDGPTPVDLNGRPSPRREPRTAGKLRACGRRVRLPTIWWHSPDGSDVAAAVNSDPGRRLNSDPVQPAFSH